MDVSTKPEKLLMEKPSSVSDLHVGPRDGDSRSGRGVRSGRTSPGHFQAREDGGRKADVPWGSGQRRPLRPERTSASAETVPRPAGPSADRPCRPLNGARAYYAPGPELPHCALRAAHAAQQGEHCAGPF